MGTPQAKRLNLVHGETTITSIRFMPDGNAFVSASFNGTVIMWNASSGKRVWSLDLDAGSETKVASTISHIVDMDVSSDGATIAVSYNQSTVKDNTLQPGQVNLVALIDPKNGQVTRTLSGHTFLMGGVAFSSDGKSLVSVSGDQTARWWSVNTGREIRQIKLKAQGGTSRFSPDGKYLVIATAPIWGNPPQSIVGLYDSQSGMLVREFPREYSQVTGITFSPDGKYLLIGGFNMPNVTTKLWNLHSPNSQRSKPILTNVKRVLGNYAYSPNGKLLAYGEVQRGRPVVSVTDWLTGKSVGTYELDAKPASLVFSPTGAQLAIGTQEGQIIVLPIPFHR